MSKKNQQKKTQTHTHAQRGHVDLLVFLVCFLFFCKTGPEAVFFLFVIFSLFLNYIYRTHMATPLSAAFVDCFERTARLNPTRNMPSAISSKPLVSCINGLVSLVQFENPLCTIDESFFYQWVYCIIRTFRANPVADMTPDLLSHTYFTTLINVVHNGPPVAEYTSRYLAIEVQLTNLCKKTNRYHAVLLNHPRCMESKCHIFVESDGTRCHPCAHRLERTEFANTNLSDYVDKCAAQYAYIIQFLQQYNTKS